jgi:hypothetical protein
LEDVPNRILQRLDVPIHLHEEQLVLQRMSHIERESAIGGRGASIRRQKTLNGALPRSKNNPQRYGADNPLTSQCHSRPNLCQ